MAPGLRQEPQRGASGLSPEGRGPTRGPNVRRIQTCTCVSQLVSSCSGPFIKMEAPTAGGVRAGPSHGPVSHIQNKDQRADRRGDLPPHKSLSSLQTQRLPGASTHILAARHIPNVEKHLMWNKRPSPQRKALFFLAPRLYLLIGASALLFFALAEHSKPFHRMFVCSHHPLLAHPPPPPPPLLCFIYSLFEKPNFCHSKPKQPRR